MTTKRPTPEKETGTSDCTDQIERALNVLQPLGKGNVLFSAPNVAPGCELTFSSLRSAIDNLREARERIAELEALLRQARWQDDGSWPRDLVREIDALIAELEEGKAK